MTGTRHRTWRTGLVAATRYAGVGISAHGIDRNRRLPAARLILGALAVTPRSRAVLRLLPGWPQRSRSTGAKTLPG